MALWSWLWKRSRRRATAHRTFRPTCEILEDRLAPATWTVTSAANDGPGTLRGIINAQTTQAGDTIVFSPQQLANQTITLLTVISTDKSITINGQGNNITIAGNGQQNLFSFVGELGAVPADEIDNLVLTNGNTSLEGGAIKTRGALTLTNDWFSNNQATFSGGAIYSSGPALANLEISK